MSREMGRSRRFLSGLFYTYGYQAMLVVSGIWLARFYLGHLGQHDYGLWLVGMQLLTYLTLTDFGVVELLPQEIAYSTGRTGGIPKASELQPVVGQTIRLILLQLPVVFVIVLGMFFSIPAEWRLLRGPLGLMLAGFVVTFPLRMLPALLQGLQDLGFAGKLQILNWALSTTATVLMVRAGFGLFALALGWLVSQLLLTPVGIYRIWKRFPGVLTTRLPLIDWPKTRNQLGKGMWLFISQIAQLLTTGTDYLFIGKLLGPSAVVPYSFTGKVISVLANQAQILMQTATPGLCEMKTGESRERILQVLVALTHAILTFSGLVFCGVVILNQWFVTWWVGSKQFGGLLLTVIFASAMILRHWTTTTAYSVFCFGYQRRISLTNLSDGVVTAASCFTFLKLFGLPGAALGTIVGACAVSLPFNLRVIARDAGVTVFELIRLMLQGWLWRFGMLGGASVWIALHWAPKSLAEAIATGIAVIVVYSAVMLPNVLKAPLGNYVRPLVSSFRARLQLQDVRSSG